MLFYSSTTWKQIAQWLVQYVGQLGAFYDREERAFFDLQQTLVSTVQPNASVMIQVVDPNVIVKVIVSCETTDYSLHVAKSITIAALFKNEQLRTKLNLKEKSIDDYVISLEQTDASRIFTKDELRQPIVTYHVEGNDAIRFRLSLSKTIVICHKHQQIPVAMTDLNITIAEMMDKVTELPAATRHLASNRTKKILNINEKLSTLNETAFLLVDDQEICQVRIIQLDETEISQQFCTIATVGDLYQEYHLDHSNQHLLFANDFVPSAVTPLTSLQPSQFKIIGEKLPVTITIHHDEQGGSLQFHGAHEMTAQRISSIACQLLNIEGDACRLTLTDETEVDGDITLADIDETTTEIGFRLHVPEGLSCSILCDGQTIVSRCQKETSLSSLVKQTLEKLQVPSVRMSAYALYSLGDDPMQIDLDLTIDDLECLFSDTPKTLSFELRREATSSEEEECVEQ